MPLQAPLRIAIVGAGNRGASYARLAAQSGLARVVAVADPDPGRRQRLADEHGIAIRNCFDGFEALAAQPRLADAVFIATMDRLHKAPALALAERGYHILLEKPMAPTPEDAGEILAATERAGVELMICHVLRYTPYAQAIRRLVTERVIGDVVSVEHLEPIGWWHFAHSYVRGNWAREAESSSMLLAKSSHDLDWLSYVIGKTARRVSSFGSLFEFRPERKPEGAGERCISCAVEATCPYSSVRNYGRLIGDPTYQQWPLGVVSPDTTAEAIMRALETGPYGLCVYNGNNDVVDHQVVNIEYEGGATASFTATAFTELAFRKTRIFGTRGCIEGDGTTLAILDFVTNQTTHLDLTVGGSASAADGHGGADGAMVKAFLNRLLGADAADVVTSARESLYTHGIVWAAEQARLTGTVVEIAQ